MFDHIGALGDRDLQRAVLEACIRHYVGSPHLHRYTHMRAEIRGTSVRWVYLIADASSIKEERDFVLGSRANALIQLVGEPFKRGQIAELTRITVQFHPPTMSIDVFDGTNSIIATGMLIDLEMEKYLRSQMLHRIKDN